MRILILVLMVFLLSACDHGSSGCAGDPLFCDQWHLKNTGQRGADGVPAATGEDINVEPVWNSCGAGDVGDSCRGEGVRVAVVDDGMEIAHEDLVDNVAPGLSHNYSSNGTDPTPVSPFDSHGTSVSGLIAARDFNNLGLRGVSPRANLVGYNVLQLSTDTNIADAMTRNAVDVDVSSNSWGPADNTGNIIDAPALWRAAVETGVTTGRGGLGTVYTWAGGNGHPTDNSNNDGQANYRRVIAVGALNDQGRRASYSERGANLLVSAPAGEFCSTHTLSTTDRTADAGQNESTNADDYPDRNYTKCFNGTSAATPVVSGAVALVLQANPLLGFRDVRAVMARSARKNDASDPEWRVNGAGLNINHKYGFGAVDVDAAVTMAATWTNLGPELIHTSAVNVVNTAIPDNNITTGISNVINVAASGITTIDFIEVTFSSTDHTFPGDLFIALTNETTGSFSVLSETHSTCQIPCTAHNNWVFGTARHLGEAADGNWTLLVRDQAVNDTGTFESWSITIYGS